MLGTDFDSWSFQFGEGDGTLGANNQIFLKDIISIEDCYTLSPDRPILIIRKTGIEKFIKWAHETAGVKEVDRIIKASVAGVNHQFWVGVTIYFEDKNGYRFAGDGEASMASTNQGIAQKFPLAMASKRAKSRAILAYLGIDAYDEDEAPEFRRVSINDLTKEDVNSITEPLGRKFLGELIPKLAKAKTPPLEGQDLGYFVRRVLGLPEDTQLTFENVSTNDLVRIIAAMEIDSKLGAEIFNKYIGT